MMSLTNTRQKISLFFLGLFLSLFLLELGLRLGGCVFVFLQERTNRRALKEGDFRILCIGESTTALGGEDSYPAQLQEILDQKNPGIKFQVVNKGLVSKSSRDILAQLPGFLERYRPRIVIAMIGVNDRHMLSGENTRGMRLRSRLGHLRTFRFFELLAKHFRYKSELVRWKFRTGGSPVPSLEMADPPVSRGMDKARQTSQVLDAAARRLKAELPGIVEEKARLAKEEQLGRLEFQQSWLLVAIGRYHRLRRDFEQARTALQSALGHYPANIGAYVELGRCFKDQGDCGQALLLFERANALKPDSTVPLLEMLRCYESLGNEPRAYAISRLLSDKDKDDPGVYSEVGDWLKEHRYLEEAEEIFLKAIEVNPYDYTIYEKLAEVYSGQGKADEAEIYFLKARNKEQELVDYLPVTVGNYRQIADMVLVRRITLICMQYPLRDIGPLQRIFPSGSGIIFVENKENFTKGLRSEGYTAYFSDSFGGDFGHCTRLGNRLIAENLADVILNKVTSLQLEEGRKDQP